MYVGNKIREIDDDVNLSYLPRNFIFKKEVVIMDRITNPFSFGLNSPNSTFSNRPIQTNDIVRDIETAKTHISREHHEFSNLMNLTYSAIYNH